MRKTAVGRVAGVGLPILGVFLLLLDDLVAGTVLTVGKSGSDVVLSWTGTGTLYDGVRATDAPFTDATTQFVGVGSTSYTYVGAVNNDRSLEFFDVTDETESNRGGNWNGGELLPLPPVINPGSPSNLGSLFIGSTGLIGGSGFSSIPEANAVCFEGGVCTQATLASPTQIQFITPPGAYTGDVTVTVGGQTSQPANSLVRLEDPALGWTFVTSLGFSRQDKSYWVFGNPLGGGFSDDSLYRVHFDDASQTWLREDRGGAHSGEFLACSTQTSRSSGPS